MVTTFRERPGTAAEVPTVSWAAIPPRMVSSEPVWPTQVRAIIVDPAKHTVDEVAMRATMSAFVELLGARPFLYCRVFEGNIYGNFWHGPGDPWWRKQDFVFPGRTVIVGVTDDDAHFIDTTISLEGLRQSIWFQAPYSSEQIRYGAGT